MSILQGLNGLDLAMFIAWGVLMYNLIKRGKEK